MNYNEQEQLPLKSYFNGFSDLERFSINNIINVEPFTGSSFDLDVNCLRLLQYDKETKLYMTDFTGDEASEKIPVYLLNTIECTKIGIAFGYAIRFERGLIGFIKITSPSHNKVTNNFDGWLIDYIMLPMCRGKKILKNVMPILLDTVVKKIGVKKLYAMVDSGNKKSINLLNFWGFVDTNTSNCGLNKVTGNKVLLYLKNL